MKMRKIAAAAMAGALAVSLAACGSSASTGTTATGEAAGSTEAGETGFTVQLGPSPETLDPALNASIDGGNTLLTIEEPLLIIDENNEVQPGQAESYCQRGRPDLDLHPARRPEVERRQRPDCC